MVLSNHSFPPDGRVEREARDLIRDGHELFLIAKRFSNQPAFEIVNGVNVIRIRQPFKSIKLLADFLDNFLYRHFVFFHILNTCRKHKIDALHVHDLPYAFATTLAGKYLKIPVIFDMHENYVVMRKTGIDAQGKLLLRPLYVLLLGLFRIEEKIACRLAQKVIVVAREHIDRIESLGVPRENILEVTNTEDIASFTGFEIDQSLVEQYRDDFIILYFGGFSAHRGLDTAIQAMPMILEKIPEAKLLLVGFGYCRKQLEDLVTDMGLGDNVIFRGYQPFEKMPTYINLCKIGLIPHISTPHVETTMPNKIFQFMMLGKPVVVSNVKPLARIIDDTQCGLIFKERDPGSLAEIIVKLANEDVRKKLGENGQKAVKEKYNWKKTVQALLEIYQKLCC